MLFSRIFAQLDSTWLKSTFSGISFLIMLIKAPGSSCISYFTLCITYCLQKIWANVISLNNTWHLIGNHYIALDWQIWKIFMKSKTKIHWNHISKLWSLHIFSLDLYFHHQSQFWTLGSFSLAYFLLSHKSDVACFNSTVLTSTLMD